MIAIKLRIMPSSSKTNIGKIKKEAEKILKRFNASLHSSEEEEIAFGLKALLLVVAWPEDKSPSLFEGEVAKIKNINSAEIIDVRKVSFA